MGALHGVPDRKATLTLLRGKAEGQASVRVPDRWLSERYLNVVATGNLVIDDGRTEFRLERLRVGRLAVPQLLRAGISRTLVWTMQRDPDIRQMLDSVIQLRLDHSAVEVAARRGALNSRVIPSMLSPLLRCICDTWWSSAVQPIANHTDRHASVRPVTISFRSGLRRAFTSFAAACTVMSPCSTFTARSGAAACTSLAALTLDGPTFMTLAAFVADFRSEDPDPVNSCCRLGLGSERRKTEAERENDREPDQPHGAPRLRTAAGESSRTPRDAPAPRSRAPGRYRGDCGARLGARTGPRKERSGEPVPSRASDARRGPPCHRRSRRRSARPFSPVQGRTPIALPTSLPSRSTRKTVGV